MVISPTGHVKADVLNGRAHALVALLHRIIRQAYHKEKSAGYDVRFHRDDGGIHPKDRAAEVLYKHREVNFDLSINPRLVRYDRSMHGSP